MRSKVFILTILLIIVISLAACRLKEEYSMQYGYSNEVVTETKVVTKSNGLNLEIPFADFSCDSTSFKAVLDRKDKTFTLSMKGTETTERCSQKFFANITGIESGTYWLKVVYDQGSQQQEVLYEQFTIAK